MFECKYKYELEDSLTSAKYVYKSQKKEAGQSDRNSHTHSNGGYGGNADRGHRDGQFISIGYRFVGGVGGARNCLSTYTCDFGAIAKEGIYSAKIGRYGLFAYNY